MYREVLVVQMSVGVVVVFLVVVGAMVLVVSVVLIGHGDSRGVAGGIIVFFSGKTGKRI